MSMPLNYVPIDSTAPCDAKDWLADYPPPRSLPLDQEACRIFTAAYVLGVGKEAPSDPPISFTTLLLALLFGDNDTSRWFKREATSCGPNLSAVLERAQASEADAAAAATRPEPSGEIRTSRDMQLLTVSASSVLLNAEAWAQRVGGTDIGVRHLIAAYVVNPPGNHRRQLESWDIKVPTWRTKFFAWVAQQFRWEAWAAAGQLPAPTRGFASFGRQKIQGSTLAWPGTADALRVLDRAAAEHSLRSDASMGLRTFMYALIDSAFVDTEVASSITPLLDAVRSNASKYEQARAKHFAAGSPESQPISGIASNDVVPPATDLFEANTPTSRSAVAFVDTDISPRVLNLLETARELAAASHLAHQGDGPSKASSLHLAGALLSPRVDADRALSEIGVDADATRAAFERFVAGRGESVEVWQETLKNDCALFEARPVELNSDEPDVVIRADASWLQDPLRIRPDVSAFAALLASRQLEPPMSIGLFGPWGSGKTTFLKRLRHSIDRLTESAKNAIPADPARATPFVQHVVHVEFNAWHFGEDALVSSLVNEIFRAIDSYIKNDTIVAGRAWSEQKAAILESTKRRFDAAESLKGSADRAVRAAEATLNTEQEAAAERAVSLRAAMSGVLAAAKQAATTSSAVKESRLLETIGDTVKSAEEIRARLERIRNRPGRMLLELGWSGTLFFALAMVALPPLVAVWVSEQLKFEWASTISAFAALVSVVGLWFKTASKAVATVDEAVTRIADAFDEKIESDEGLKTAKRAMVEAEARVSHASANLEQLRGELARAEREAAEATLPAQMLRLVGDRIQGREYGKELTTLSLARGDLERLSHLLTDQRTTPPAAEGARNDTVPSPLRAVDRVILYVDDLDRCRPEDVVRVLQLVHMLLSFELFAVIVAVDARWVEAALRQNYPWFGAQNAPNRVKSVASSSTSGTYELLTGNAGVPPFSEDYISPRDYLEKIFQLTFWLEPMSSDRAARYLGTLTRPRCGIGGSYASPELSLDISTRELDFMRALAAHVGTSPRRVKRLVNSYRLIKARLSPDQLRGFISICDRTDRIPRPGPYQIVLGLLAIGAGARRSGAEILELLAQWDPRAPIDCVLTHLQSRPEPDWKMAAKVIQTLVRSQDLERACELRGWARCVDRFLLHRAH